MTLVNICLVNLTSASLQCACAVLDFLWFDIFDVKRIQIGYSFSESIFNMTATHLANEIVNNKYSIWKKRSKVSQSRFSI